MPHPTGDFSGSSRVLERKRQTNHGPPKELKPTCKELSERHQFLSEMEGTPPPPSPSDSDGDHSTTSSSTTSSDSEGCKRRKHDNEEGKGPLRLTTGRVLGANPPWTFIRGGPELPVPPVSRDEGLEEDTCAKTREAALVQRFERVDSVAEARENDIGECGGFQMHDIPLCIKTGTNPKLRAIFLQSLRDKNKAWRKNKRKIDAAQQAWDELQAKQAWYKTLSPWQSAEVFVPSPQNGGYLGGEAYRLHTNGSQSFQFSRHLFVAAHESSQDKMAQGLFRMECCEPRRWLRSCFMKSQIVPFYFFQERRFGIGGLGVPDFTHPYIEEHPRRPRNQQTGIRREFDETEKYFFRAQIAVLNAANQAMAMFPYGNQRDVNRHPGDYAFVFRSPLQRDVWMQVYCQLEQVLMHCADVNRKHEARQNKKFDALERRREPKAGDERLLAYKDEELEWCRPLYFYFAVGRIEDPAWNYATDTYSKTGFGRGHLSVVPVHPDRSFR